MAKRKRSDSEEKEAPASKPTASSDSETSDSDDEVNTVENVVVNCCHIGSKSIMMGCFL